MMKRSDCFNCHSVDQKRVGPPLLEIADKYRDKPGAIEQSIERVLKGSTGAWGKIPMIPHSQHTAAEVRQMVSWVYSLEGAGAVRVYNGFVGDIQLPTDDAKEGAYLNLEASYLDRGLGEVPPLNGTASLMLRGRLLQAEHADQIAGPQVLGSGNAGGGKFVGAINHNHHLMFQGIQLDQVQRITMQVASAGSGGRIEVHLDKPDGPLVATVEVEVNGNWEQFYQRSVPLEGTSGKHDVYLVFVNAQRQGGLMNLDSVYFAGE
jgi:cytochrome c